MRVLRTIGRACVRVGQVLVSLVRDDAYTDVRATYPEHARATQEQVATNGFVAASLTGFGGTH